MIFPCDCEIHHVDFLSACFLLLRRQGEKHAALQSAAKGQTAYFQRDLSTEVSDDR